MNEIDDCEFEPFIETPRITIGVAFAEAQIEYFEMMTKAEDLQREATELLRQAIYDVGAKTRGDEELSRYFLHNFYWRLPQAKEDWLKEAFGLSCSPRTAAGKGTRIVSCSDCGSGVEIAVKTRRELKGKRSVQCASCKEVSRRGARGGPDTYLDRKVRRLKALQTMPYREYLLSPEWKETRKGKLRKVGYRCQLCNSSSKEATLNVHHRSYDAPRGLENDNDLIVLCQPCHAKFHGVEQRSDIGE